MGPLHVQCMLSGQPRQKGQEGGGPASQKGRTRGVRSQSYRQNSSLHSLRRRHTHRQPPATHPHPPPPPRCPTRTRPNDRILTMLRVFDINSGAREGGMVVSGETDQKDQALASPSPLLEENGVPPSESAAWLRPYPALVSTLPSSHGHRHQPRPPGTISAAAWPALPSAVSYPHRGGGGERAGCTSVGRGRKDSPLPSQRRQQWLPGAEGEDADNGLSASCASVTAAELLSTSMSVVTRRTYTSRKWRQSATETTKPGI